MRAGLGAHVDPVAPGGQNQLDAARRRHVADVQPYPRGPRQLQAAGDRLVLGHRRARARMGEGIAAMAGGLLGRDPGADDLVVLGVHADQAARLRDRGERTQHLSVRDAREALRVGLEGGQLERGRAGVDEVGDLVDRAAGRDRRPQRHVDDRLAAHVGDLGLERGQRVDGAGGVVGHVDDRRHAAGGRRARAPLDPLLGVAARVDVDVDGAGEEERVPVVIRAGGGRVGRTNVDDAPLRHRHAGAAHRSVGLEDLTRDLLADWDVGRIHFPPARERFLNQRDDHPLWRRSHRGRRAGRLPRAGTGGARRSGARARPRRARRRGPGTGQRGIRVRAEHRPGVAVALSHPHRGDRRVLVCHGRRPGGVLRPAAGHRRRARGGRLTGQRDAQGGGRRATGAHRGPGGAAQPRGAPGRAHARLGRPGRPVGDGRHRQGADRARLGGVRRARRCAARRRWPVPGWRRSRSGPRRRWG